MIRRALPLTLLLAAASSVQALSPVTDEQLADETGQAGLTVNLNSPGITATSIKLVDDGNNLELGAVAWQPLDGSSIGSPGGQFKHVLTLDAGTAGGLQELRLGLNSAISRQRLSAASLRLGNNIDAGTALLDIEGNSSLLASVKRNGPYVLSGTGASYLALNLTPTNSRFVFKDTDASPNGGSALYYSNLTAALYLQQAQVNLVSSGTCGTLTNVTGLCVVLPTGNSNKLDVTIGNLAILDNAATTAPAATDRAWAGTVNMDINNAWWLLQGQGSDGSQGLGLDGYIKFNNASGLTFYDSNTATLDANRSYGFRQLTGSLTLNNASVDVTSSGLTVKLPDLISTNDADTLRFDSLEIGGNKLGAMQFRNFQSSLEFTIAGH